MFTAAAKVTIFHQSARELLNRVSDVCAPVFSRKRSFDTQAGKVGSKHVLCDKSPLGEKSQKDTTVRQINY